MMVLLSPAKKQAFDQAIPHGLSLTSPPFEHETATLVDLLKQHTADDLQELMGISAALANLNVERYHDFEMEALHSEHARPALWAFRGDVYRAFQADTLTDEDWLWAQDHLTLLSGLFGLLRPLDAMLPHRLEMGLPLHVQGQRLVDFWRPRLTALLAERVAADELILNLASQEYSQAVDAARFDDRWVEVIFQTEKQGRRRSYGLLSKRARGLMARYLVDHRINSIQGVMAFQEDGYQLLQEQSDERRLVFLRQHHAS